MNPTNIKSTIALHVRVACDGNVLNPQALGGHVCVFNQVERFMQSRKSTSFVSGIQVHGEECVSIETIDTPYLSRVSLL